MTAVMPISLLNVKATEIGSGVLGTVASGYSGLELAGTIGGVVGSGCAVVALILSAIAGNAKRKRQYDDDIRAAEERGRLERADDLAQTREERDDYRDRYLNLLEARRVAPPPPPVRRRRPDVSNPDEPPS